MTEKKTAHRLQEIDFMRPIVIVLLVMMHSFAIYSGGGGWEPPVGIAEVQPYKWIHVITYGCMLEAFTFISGYLFGFQLQKKPMSLLKVVGSKAKRLLIPSVLFSILYLVLLGKHSGGVLSALYSIVCGYAHLWYLPMLFWCFLATWCITRIKINETVKLALIYACSILSVVSLPLKITLFFHYLPFFYLGVYLYNKPLKEISFRKAFLYIITFLIVLIAVSSYRSTHVDLLSWQKALFWYVKQFYATIGTIGLFVLCKAIGNKHDASKQLLQFNACSFGIYIFHQFLLDFMYYHTPLPNWCGSYFLPWCGFIIAFSVSFGMTWVFRKIKIGRFLLG